MDRMNRIKAIRFFDPKQVVRIYPGYPDICFFVSFVYVVVKE